LIKRLKSPFLSNPTRTVLVLLLLGVVAVASATVYQFFYANAAGSVQSPNVTLAAGTDASGSCSAYPCAMVSVSPTSDTATVTLSVFKGDTTYTPTPSTYYTNLVLVKDAANSHSVLGVTVTSISSTSSSDFGRVVIYYCSAQCTFDVNGNVAGGTEVGSFVMTSTTGGTITGFPQSITAGATHYIEVVAYAGSGASTSDTISFQVAVQWV
jgi:hypothetical protein